MAYGRTAVLPRGFVATPPKPRERRSLWQRLHDALEDSRQRAIDREIEAYLRARGGKLTDRVERDIEQIMFSPTRW